DAASGRHGLGPDADGARGLRDVCGAAVGDWPGCARGDDQSLHQFLAQGCAGPRCACGSEAAEAREAACGWRGAPVVGVLARSDRPCHRNLFHSKYVMFSTVLYHLNCKSLNWLTLVSTICIDAGRFDL